MLGSVGLWRVGERIERETCRASVVVGWVSDESRGSIDAPRSPAHLSAHPSHLPRTQTSHWKLVNLADDSISDMSRTKT